MPAYTEYADAEGFMKNDFIPGFQSQVQEEDPAFYKMLEPKSDLVKGLDVIFSARLENPQGVASRRTASRPLPKAVAGKYIRLTVGLGRVYGVLEFDSAVLKSARTDRGAFADYMEGEMSGLKDTFLADKGRQVFGDGKGALSVCGTTSGVLIVQLGTAANMRYFVEGMRVDIALTATGVNIANGEDREIQSVDVDNKRITLDASGGVVTTDSTHSVYKHDAYDAEMTGLESVNSATADIYGVSTASQRRWKAYVATSQGAFDIKSVLKVVLAAQTRSGVYSDLIVSSPLRQMQYWYQLTGTRTFNIANQPIPVKKYGVGYTALEVTIDGQVMTWMAEHNCVDGNIHGVRKEHLGMQHLGPANFMSIGDTILLPNIYGASGTPTFKSVLEYYPEMICKRRNALWKMEGVTDLSGW